jgi:hypothetical protein
MYDSALVLKNKGSSAFQEGLFESASDLFKQARKMFLASASAADSLSKAAAREDTVQLAETAEETEPSLEEKTAKVPVSSLESETLTVGLEDPNESRPDESLRQDAVEARENVELKRRKAAAESAERFAGELYRSAREQEKSAERLLSEDSVGEAQRAYERSGVLYDSAQGVAMQAIAEGKSTLQHQSSRIDRLKSQLPANIEVSNLLTEAQNEETLAVEAGESHDFAKAVSHYENATALYDSLLKAHRRRAVNSTLDRFEAAFRQRSLDQLEAVYPTMPEDWRTGYGQLFANARDLDVALDLDDLRLDDERAFVSLSANLKYKDSSGKKDFQIKWKMEREETEGAWTIIEVEALE